MNLKVSFFTTRQSLCKIDSSDRKGSENSCTVLPILKVKSSCLFVFKKERKKIKTLSLS